jgi:hypothetical protein
LDFMPYSTNRWPEHSQITTYRLNKFGRMQAVYDAVVKAD